MYCLQEKTANVTKSVSNSPVLGRTFQNLDASTTKTATMVGLPQATLDLSGPNSRVLELSTLAYTRSLYEQSDINHIPIYKSTLFLVLSMGESGYRVSHNFFTKL